MNSAGAVLLRSAQTVGQQGKTEKEVLIQGCRDEQCRSSASEVGTDSGTTRKNRKRTEFYKEHIPWLKAPNNANIM